MKKIKLLMAAVLVAGLGFTSCSSDDEAAVRGEVNGQWNLIKTTVKLGSDTITQNYADNQAGCDKDYIEFASNGVLNAVAYVLGGAGTCTEDAADPGTWGRSDNTLTVSGGFPGTQSDIDGTYEIIKLNGSELQLRSSNSSGGVSSVTTIYFKKAANQN